MPLGPFDLLICTIYNFFVGPGKQYLWRPMSAAADTADSYSLHCLDDNHFKFQNNEPNCLLQVSILGSLCMLKVTVISHVFTNIFQRAGILTVKFTKSHHLISKSKKENEKFKTTDQAPLIKETMPIYFILWKYQIWRMRYKQRSIFAKIKTEVVLAFKSPLYISAHVYWHLSANFEPSQKCKSAYAKIEIMHKFLKIWARVEYNRAANK